MPLLILLVYIIVEVAAIAGLVSLVGFWWTLAIILGSILAGSVLFASQTRSSMRQVSAAMHGEGSPASALADTATVGVAGILLTIPGIVTSAIGLLILFPPTRVLLRPVVPYLFFRQQRRAAERMGYTGMGFPGMGDGPAGRRRGGTIIDGEVVDTSTRPTAEDGTIIEGEIAPPPPDGPDPGEKQDPNEEDPRQ
ncbi:FxsA family protein [Lolliginicoccus suaedae]|uniref:FxsA family protein n=1 Tax=Lolliginicoccus suaedae TaxID=2605429 RepID=UPI0011EBFF16|nr:FxsA family protein [Lolliginicoccus suaedae]